MAAELLRKLLWSASVRPRRGLNVVRNLHGGLHNPDLWPRYWGTLDARAGSMDWCWRGLSGRARNPVRRDRHQTPGSELRLNATRFFGCSNRYLTVYRSGQVGTSGTGHWRRCVPSRFMSSRGHSGQIRTSLQMTASTAPIATRSGRAFVLNQIRGRRAVAVAPASQ